MSRPVPDSTHFVSEAGNQPASQLDTWFSNLRGAINDSASGWVNGATDTGSVNTYSVTLNPPPSGYVTGFTIAMTPANTNSGPSTINVNGIGSVSILNILGNQLQAGDIVAGQVATMVYTGANFLLVYQSGSSLPTNFSQFFVGPGPGLSVNVTQLAPQLFVGNTSHFNAGSTTPANVSLTAPGTNSRYSLIYYDTNAGTFGVINGPIAASPSLAQIQFPNFYYQLPLAAVLVAAAATSVLQTQILDLRSIWSSFKPFVYSNTSLANTVAIDCFGTSSLVVQGQFTTTITQLNLNNVPIGIPISINIGNTSGGAGTFRIGATTPDGVAYGTVDFYGTSSSSGPRQSWGSGSNVPSPGSLYFNGKTFVSGATTIFRGQLSIATN